MNIKKKIEISFNGGYPEVQFRGNVSQQDISLAINILSSYNKLNNTPVKNKSSNIDIPLG